MGGTDDKEQEENSGDAECVHYPDCGFLDVNVCQNSLKCCVLKMYSLHQLFLNAVQKGEKSDCLNDHFHLHDGKIQRNIYSEARALWREVTHWSR